MVDQRQERIGERIVGLDRLDQERDERNVRELVADLNTRIRDAVARRVEGPVVFVKTVDVEAAVEGWRERRRS